MADAVVLGGLAILLAGSLPAIAISQFVAWLLRRRGMAPRPASSASMPVLVGGAVVASLALPLAAGAFLLPLFFASQVLWVVTIAIEYSARTSESPERQHR